MKDHLRDYFPQRFENHDGITKHSLMTVFNLGKEDARAKISCEKKVINVFKKSNELKLLAGAMKKYGCDFDLGRHVVCEDCFNCNAGYDPDTNQIVMCRNTFKPNDVVMSALMHEMIHMFDYCRAKFDFNNLDHVACSEMRAANLTYCGVSDNFSLGNFFKLKGQHPECVKEVAFRSVKAYSPETSEEAVWNIIDKVFPYCYNDLEPFGRRPNGTDHLKQSFRERYYYGYTY